MQIIAVEKVGTRWRGKFCTGRFWHTVRGKEGEELQFYSKRDAEIATREEWWVHSTGYEAGHKTKGPRGKDHA